MLPTSLHYSECSKFTPHTVPISASTVRCYRNQSISETDAAATVAE